jgi:hypothetical protein
LQGVESIGGSSGSTHTWVVHFTVWEKGSRYCDVNCCKFDDCSYRGNILNSFNRNETVTTTAVYQAHDAVYSSRSLLSFGRSFCFRRQERKVSRTERNGGCKESISGPTTGSEVKVDTVNSKGYHM